MPVLLPQSNDPQFFNPVQKGLIVGKGHVSQMEKRTQLDFPQSDRYNYNPGAESVVEGYNSKSVKINLSDKCNKDVKKPDILANFDTLSSIYEEEELEQFSKNIRTRKYIHSPELEKSECESVISSFSAFKVIE